MVVTGSRRTREDSRPELVEGSGRGVTTGSSDVRAEPRIREQARDTLAVAAFSLGASVTATAFVWVLLWCLG